MSLGRDRPSRDERTTSNKGWLLRHLISTSSGPKIAHFATQQHSQWPTSMYVLHLQPVFVHHLHTTLTHHRLFQFLYCRSPYVKIFSCWNIQMRWKMRRGFHMCYLDCVICLFSSLLFLFSYSDSLSWTVNQIGLSHWQRLPLIQHFQSTIVKDVTDTAGTVVRQTLTSGLTLAVSLCVTALSVITKIVLD